MFSCNYCTNTYKWRQGLQRHKNLHKAINTTPNDGHDVKNGVNDANAAVNGVKNGVNDIKKWYQKWCQ